MKSEQSKLLNEFRYQIVVRDEILRSLSLNYSCTSALYFEVPNRQLDPIWSHIRFQLFKSTIIDFSKLLNDKKNELFNIFRLFRQIETGNFRAFQIKREKINSYKKRLNQFKIETKKMIDFRDEKVAHTDTLSGYMPSKSFLKL